MHPQRVLHFRKLHSVGFTEGGCSRWPKVNLANFLGLIALPQEIDSWSLVTLQDRLVKTGAKVVRHEKYATFQFAEVAVKRTLFVAIPYRIIQLAIHLLVM
ncbi:hypothetical protein Pla144_36860 [Bythopirellula polymerisocia]|uniref:Uncharacterized protein n=1 Tax=Bythopirellula polymerisocia TaxID=2528003 RepID=A0A5C6CJP4_9BACT|nr:hypothetical protein Pla144_36860 [Bythopirellula polymerisocia]